MESVQDPLKVNNCIEQVIIRSIILAPTSISDGETIRILF